MNRKTRPTDVKKELEKILSHFNQKILKDTLFPYTVKYRGNYAYFGVMQGNAKFTVTVVPKPLQSLSFSL